MPKDDIVRVIFDNLSQDICSPFFDKFGSLHVVFTESGQVAVLRDDVKIVHSTNGQASAASFDHQGELMYITDYAHGAVLVKGNHYFIPFNKIFPQSLTNFGYLFRWTKSITTT